MLPAVHRLQSSSDFTEVTRHGRKATVGPVVAYVLFSDAPGAARLGLTVGRQVGGSVMRHRVSRVLRAGMAAQIAGLPSGTRVVLRALPGSGEDDDLAGHAQQALSAAMAKAGRS